MSYHREQLSSSYSTDKIFALVADVERYPEFLPWCRAARILSRNGNVMLAELVVSFKGLTESYTSEVILNSPVQSGAQGSIDVKMVEGPFEYLTNKWDFAPTSQGGTLITLELDFKFRSRLLNMMIGGIFEKAESKMAEAFKERADQLYGPKK